MPPGPVEKSNASLSLVDYRLEVPSPGRTQYGPGFGVGVAAAGEMEGAVMELGVA